jgi:hypothetical protein
MMKVDQLNERTLPEVVTPADVHIYKTLAGSWRAYLRADPSIQVWGWSHDAADALFREMLSKDEIPFDWSDAL